MRLLEDTNHMVSSLVTISANELMTAYYMVPSLVTISRSELMTAYHIVPSLVTISRSELMTANHMVGCLVNIGHNELRFESAWQQQQNPRIVCVKIRQIFQKKYISLVLALTALTRHFW